VPGAGLGGPGPVSPGARALRPAGRDPHGRHARLAQRVGRRRAGLLRDRPPAVRRHGRRRRPPAHVPRRTRARGGGRTRDLTLTRRLLWPSELLGQGHDDTGTGRRGAPPPAAPGPPRVLASLGAPGQPWAVLSDRDRAILDFERGCWRLPSPKGAAIRAHLDLSPTRYYQLLGALLDD